MFLDHTQRRSTVGRTPLDEWSARRRDLYLTTHDTHNRQISMPPVGFDPTISAGVGSNPTGGMDICLLWMSCVVRQRSLRRADHSSRGVLPNVLRRCVWSRNIKNGCSIYIYDISRLRVNRSCKTSNCNIHNVIMWTNTREKNLQATYKCQIGRRITKYPLHSEFLLHAPLFQNISIRHKSSRGVP